MSASTLYNFMAGPGFAPDLEKRTPNIIPRGTNFVPTVWGMEAADAAKTVGYPTLTATASAAFCAKNLSGTSLFFVGIPNTSIVTPNGQLLAAPSFSVGTALGSWTDLTRTAAAGGAYTHETWAFAQFGNYTLATGLAGDVQVYTGSGKFNNVTSTGLAGYKHIESVNQFVFLANTTATSDCIRWSALGDCLSWVPAQSTQAGKKRITEGQGPITAIRRLQDGITVFKQNAMFYGRYVGPPDFWAFNQVSQDVGTLDYAKVCNAGTALFFADTDLLDLWVFDGSQPTRLNCPAMRWLKTPRSALLPGAGVSVASYSARGGNYQVVHKPSKQCVMFVLEALDGSTYKTVVLFFNYQTRQWGVAEYDYGVFFEWEPGTTPVSSAEQLFGASKDVRNVAYIRYSDKQVYALVGTNVNMELYTGDIGDGNDKLCTSSFKPQWNAKPTGTITLVDEYKELEEDSTYTGVTAISDGASFFCLQTAYYHRLKLSASTATGIGSLSGIRIWLEQDGEE